MELTTKEREVIHHSLTGSNPLWGVYRNYFAARKGHHSEPELKSLVEKKAMHTGKKYDGEKGLFYYHVTAEGARAAGLHLPTDAGANGPKNQRTKNAQIRGRA